MIQDYLLTCMIGCYIIPILIVWYSYKNNGSISEIIYNNDYRLVILLFMIMMGIFTFKYETRREHWFSIYIILLLLFSIYGVICTKENTQLHAISAFGCFIAILLFMSLHCFIKMDVVLYVLLFTQILLFVLVGVTDAQYFCILEGSAIFVFAVFYLYLHYREHFVSRL